jgi:hypothetical protein
MNQDTLNKENELKKIINDVYQFATETLTQKEPDDSNKDIMRSWANLNKKLAEKLLEKLQTEHTTYITLVEASANASAVKRANELYIDRLQKVIDGLAEDLEEMKTLYETA